jgi:hypothetical protein
MRRVVVVVAASLSTISPRIARAQRAKRPAADSSSAAIAQRASAQQNLGVGVPALVEVYRDSLRESASLDVYRKRADYAAGLCRQWICPHPYLGIETLTGTPEVWFLNFFNPADDTARVGRLYAAKPELSKRLAQAVAKNVALVVASNTFAVLEPTPVTQLRLQGSRFVVIARPGNPAIRSSALYRDPAGRAFSFVFARTREAADSVANEIGPAARVFAIRKRWSQPDPSWVRADPTFWGDWPSGLPTGDP